MVLLNLSPFTQLSYKSINIIFRLMLDDSNVQHEKLVLKLVEPKINGYSVDRLSESKESNEPPKKKLKST